MIKKDIIEMTPLLSEISKTNNTQEMWDYFKTNLLKTIDKNIPQKTNSSRYNLPWITRDLRRAIRKKQRIYNMAKKSNSKESWIYFKQLRKDITDKLRNSYWEYLNNKLEPSLDRNSKKLWQFIKAKKKDNIGISKLIVENKPIKDSKEKAEALNNYFASVFTEENNHYMPWLGKSPNPTMDCIQIDTNGIQKQLDKLNTNKAPGPDGITAKILNLTSKEISPILKLIFQHSLDNGQVPSDWKEANITPIFKKGSRNDTKNYRPVSLTSITSKVMEHIMTSNIMSFLDKNNILYDLQHGFRKKQIL